MLLRKVVLMTTTTFEDVLQLAKQLRPSDQVRLLAKLAPTIVVALESAAHVAEHNALPGSWMGLDPMSQAARLASDPTSALYQAVRLRTANDLNPTDDDIARWREERFS